MKCSPKKQIGHAALLFILMAPLFIGFFILAIDGSYAIQMKARLGDATEVAVLALAANNSEDSAQNRVIAKGYIRTYLPDVDLSIENIQRKECLSSDERICDGSKSFSQYELNTSILQAPWMLTLKDIPGFHISYTVNQSSGARKYLGDSIDIVFVLDYSTSMNSVWHGRKKYIQLRNILNKVLDELESYRNIQDLRNRVALIPYSTFTVRPRDDFRCPQSTAPLRFVDELYYEDMDREGQNGLVDVDKTVRAWRSSRARDPKMVCNFSAYGNNPWVQNFENVPFNSNFLRVKNKLRTFSPGGRTASYQGIIKAAQYIEQLREPNPRQLIVILSDGKDNKPNRSPMSNSRNHSVTRSLVNAGLCRSIENRFNNKKTSKAQPVNFQFALIGFGYNVRSNPLTNCVGMNNVYSASDPDKLLEIILDLISEEIGHLYEN